MKNLILINGTMGAGKTATSRQIQKMLPKCVFLDGDWCWDASPFIVTDETKNMVQNNIGYLLNNFLNCSAYENVIFCWVMHEESIIDEILSIVQHNDYHLFKFSIVCTEEALISRIKRDVENGIRSEFLIGRSITRLQKYNQMDTQKIDTTDISPEQVAQLIYNAIYGGQQK